MEPARNVGGDFYDVLPLENRRVGLAIADVSDKGVPAALFMMSSRTLLKGSAIGYMDDVAGLMTELNDLLVEDNEASMFVTLFYGVFNPHNGQFIYANGGHNAPIIYHADGTTTMLPLTNGIALAVVPELDFEMNTVTLTPGDTLVLYTDGVTEAMNGSKEEFETSRLLKIFEGNPPSNAQQANEAVFQAVRDFVGDTPQSDDITSLSLHYSGPAP
jgi:sigma-B regulation protein RsbU (phosphoserine phosphatase)